MRTQLGAKGLVRTRVELCFKNSAISYMYNTKSDHCRPKIKYVRVQDQESIQSFIHGNSRSFMEI